MFEKIRIIIERFKNFPSINLFIYFVISLIISFIWLSVCLYFDRKKPEPAKQIIKIFFWGLIAVFPVLFIGGPISNLIISLNLSHIVEIIILSFFIDALFEEGTKFLILFKSIYRSKFFDEPRDGMIYGITLGLGFAFLENILYGLFFKNLVVGTEIIILRGVSTTLVHFLAGGIVGYFFGLAKFLPHLSKQKRNWLIIWGLILAIIFHGFYDMFLRFEAVWCLIPISILLITTYFFILKNIQKLSRLSQKN